MRTPGRRPHGAFVSAGRTAGVTGLEAALAAARAAARVAALATALGAPCAAQQPTTPAVSAVSYADLVNARIGTRGKVVKRHEGYREAGFTFPGAAYPFGMVQFTPTFHAPEKGFVANQLSGAGCENMGNFPTRPMRGELTAAPGDMHSLGLVYRMKRSLARVFGFETATSPNDFSAATGVRTATAGYFHALLGGEIGAELTVTKRTGMARYTFPKGIERATILIGTGVNATAVTEATVRLTGSNTIEATADGGSFCGTPTNYKVHLVAQFDATPVASGTWEREALNAAAKTASGPSSGAYFTFDVTAAKVVQYKFAISYVSVANARMNLAAENPGWDFAATRQAAAAAWNRYLGRVEAKGGSADRTTQFYTHLYHAFLHPSVASDVNGEYMGGDRRMHTTTGRDHFTGLSNWDTYRTQIQLLSLLAPEVASDVIASTIAFAEQSGGGFPRWVLADVETGTMYGDPTSLVVANAYAFGARSFDTNAALAVMRRGAEHPGTKSQNTLTRPLLSQYLAKGFVPGSLQLEYTSADFAIARFALETTKDDALYRTYLERSRLWTRLYNPERGWLQSRDANGSWRKPAEDWQEGSYQSYFWMVPYDLAGLVDTIGPRVAEERLDELFVRLDAGYQDQWFAAGNQPDFHVPWAYNWVGAPHKAQAVVKRILHEQYANRDDGLPGNDDLGSMGAWYVFASIGLYPVIPGVGGFSLNSPSFPLIVIHLPANKTLTIVGGSESQTYVQSLRVNGNVYDGTWLPLRDVQRGGVMAFTLSDTPNPRWGAAVAPPSYR